MTQSLQILRYLQSGESLTVLKALELFGCYALSQRVGELRRSGEPIKSELIEVSSGKRVSQYSWDWDSEKIAY